MSDRTYAPITVKELKVRVETACAGGGLGDLITNAGLGKDIKVSFDLENVSWGGPNDFGPDGLMGYRTLPGGPTILGLAAGGDWEHPVYFCVYWDGKRLRAYVPTGGNPWNRKTRAARGGEDYEDPDDYEFEPGKILADVLARLKPVRVSARAGGRVEFAVGRPNGDEAVRVTVTWPRADGGRPRRLRLTLSPADFALAVTGRGGVTAEVEETGR